MPFSFSSRAANLRARHRFAEGALSHAVPCCATRPSQPLPGVGPHPATRWLLAPLRAVLWRCGFGEHSTSGGQWCPCFDLSTVGPPWPAHVHHAPLTCVALRPTPAARPGLCRTCCLYPFTRVSPGSPAVVDGLALRLHAAAAASRTNRRGWRLRLCVWGGVAPVGLCCPLGRLDWQVAAELRDWPHKGRERRLLLCSSQQWAGRRCLNH